LGIALAESGRIDDAIEQFRKGLQLNPGDKELRENFENAIELKSLAK
jgi:Flp pilus assembly protein TadD